jgi:hypothetical protein
MRRTLAPDKGSLIPMPLCVPASKHAQFLGQNVSDRGATHGSNRCIRKHNPCHIPPGRMGSTGSRHGSDDGIRGQRVAVGPPLRRQGRDGMVNSTHALGVRKGVPTCMHERPVGGCCACRSSPSRGRRAGGHLCPLDRGPRPRHRRWSRLRHRRWSRPPLRPSSHVRHEWRHRRARWRHWWVRGFKIPLALS